MKKLTSFVFLVCFSFSTLSAFEVDFLNRLFSLGSIQNEKLVLTWAKEHLPQTGILKRNKEGFIYLKVDDGYINQLLPLLKNPAYERPSYFRRLDSPGAHISVIYVNETRGIRKIKELGKKFVFKIKRLAFVPKRTGKYIVLQVEAPELAQLREKYGLGPYLNSHEFHITIAKKKYF